MRRVTRGRTAAWILAASAMAGCGDDASEPEGFCDTAGLPLSGGADAPVVTDVALDVQGAGIVAIATATDPQGSENLADVLQSLGVFPTPDCEGEPVVVQDDLVGSGVEEAFGTVVDAAARPELYGDIAAAGSWPVEVDFRDADGNRTTGVVDARVVR